MGKSKTRLVLWDFVISFMWVWVGVLVKLFVYNVLGMSRDDPRGGDILMGALSLIYIFFFALLEKLTEGGTYNPLTVLASAVSGHFTQFLFTVAARIPAQVIGSIVGVKLIIDTFPEVGGLGPHLSVNIHQGALTEGILTYLIVIISLGLEGDIIPGSFYLKTWISSITKLTLHILGSDLTGGCMNPASVLGWACARAHRITKEHVIVYLLAPIEATLLAVWSFRLVFKPLTVEKDKLKAKSE